ncbi:MAG: hypothetical protein AAFX53_17710 [Bacteroidota bacterium]
MKKVPDTILYTRIIGLLQLARTQALSAVNREMMQAYFEIGRIIVEEE